MRQFYYSVAATAVALALTACGGDDSQTSATLQTSTFTLSVSDAPIDEANKVVLAFEDVVLVPFDPDTGLPTGDPVAFDLSVDDLPRKVDLMQYQGSNAEVILSGMDVAPGDYAMCLYTKDGTVAADPDFSYVEKTDQTTKGLVVPSKGSCFGYKPDTSDQGRLKFSGGGEYVTIHTGHNSYVVEFDLRQGLANPQGKDYMLMNSNAVHLINDSEAGHIAGSVTEELYLACEAEHASLNAINNVDAVHAVYLYPNPTESGVVIRNQMGDMGADNPPLVNPVAMADVIIHDDGEGNLSYSYEFGYIGPGYYSLGYTCTAYVDSSDNHETELEGFAIYQDYSPVEVMAGHTAEQNLTLPTVTEPEPVAPEVVPQA